MLLFQCRCQSKILTNSSDIRLAIAEFIDSEMKLVHDQTSSMELAADAQRYVDELAQRDSQAKKNAVGRDLIEFREDHFEELAVGLVKRVCEKLNNFLASKGRAIEPRVSLSRKMKNEDVDDDSESDSNDKREEGASAIVMRCHPSFSGEIEPSGSS